MGYAAQNFRELLALARLLRRHAQEKTYDGQQELLLDTAAALEVRAFAMASNGDLPDQMPDPDTPPHVKVDLMV